MKNCNNCLYSRQTMCPSRLECRKRFGEWFVTKPENCCDDHKPDYTTKKVGEQ